MKLIPPQLQLTEVVPDDGGSDFDPRMYVPWGFAVDQRAYPRNFVPGALCVKARGLGICMASLARVTPILDWDWRKYSFWQLSLHQGITSCDFTNNYRPSRWLDFQGSELKVGTKLVFDPTYEFTKEQRVNKSKLPNKQMRTYGFDSLAGGTYKRWKLHPGKTYQLDFAYDEPYIKVKGVELIMSAEAFKLA